MAGILVFVLMILLLLTTVIKPSAVKPDQKTPLTTPIATIADDPKPIINPSNYANDEEVLKLETELKKLEKDLIDVDLRESSLNPPNLDMKIVFEP